ncbi:MULTISPECIES: hypothetical protein [unclassified Streptomyces]|uniref:hypothetical protein n=1 Tax=unclassified Streptomyces TaxID=2593676 RepID=UPI001380F75D|nr:MULTISPECIES: hypothetical protein [unclassified Streptomyces]NEA01716.1 hypothetical protein [Streptomyces sp. SID10116]MYY81300.1 hypothetical protein [Streptomyces sp. SID335]MYZ18884.1 hypothetical protein [Streptomyces sp. SID337]NDZ90669.1 hypothetical protein [Streptomyces sp. SID10115]NEB43189.1 hypothetical protein [Streptomyces sp. SID339]
MRYESDAAGDAAERVAGRPEGAPPEERDPPLRAAVRRRAVLSVADTPGPLLVVLTDWWIRSL